MFVKLDKNDQDAFEKKLILHGTCECKEPINKPDPFKKACNTCRRSGLVVSIFRKENENER